MSDAENTPDPETGEDAKPEETANPKPDAKGDEWDPDRARKTIETLREREKAGKQAEKRAAELEARLKELEDAQLSEQERQTKRLSELEAQAAQFEAERRDLMLRAEFHRLAPTLGVADAELAYLALDRAAIEYGKDGAPTNLADALTALLDSKPILRGQPMAPKPTSTDGGDGNNQGPAPNLTAAELEAAKAAGMDPHRYAALKSAKTLDDFRALKSAA